MAKHITIEQAGTIGTANHVFSVSKPVAVAEQVTDYLGRTDRWDLRSVTSREVIGQLTCTGLEDVYTAWNVDEIRGQSGLAQSHVTFMQGITAILGKPGAGYDYYRKAS